MRSAGADRRLCPHCQTPLPDGVLLCPRCGNRYWEPGLTSGSSEDDASDQDGDGCLAIVLWPFVFAAGVTLFLVFSGILINVFAHWESRPFEVLWILASAGCGILAYRAFSKRRKARSGSGPDDPQI